MRQGLLLIIISQGLLTLPLPNLRAELIGYWRFEEAGGPTVDEVAGRNGDLFNVTRVEGRFGQGVRFNGTNSHVFVGATGTELELKGSPYTIAFWMKWGGSTGLMQEMIAMDDGADYHGGYQVMIDATLQFVHNNGVNQHWKPGFPPSDQWQHLAVTWDGSQRKVYRDGQLAAVQSTPGHIVSDGNDPLIFGAIFAPCCGGMVNFFKGDLDEIRIYNHALSEAELANVIVPGLEILGQPSNQKIAFGQTAVFRAEAISRTGDEVYYQWEKNGIAITGATNETLVVGEQEPPGISTYRVKVASEDHEADSRPATLQIVSELIPGLLARWSFDETEGNRALDSEFRFPGTLVNAERIEGKIGTGALRFNGADAYVLVGGIRSSLELTNSDYTLSWWQRWNGPNGRLQQILAMDDGADHTGGYSAYLDESRNLFVLHNAGGDSRTSLGRIQAAQWQHVAVTFDGTTRRLYLGGVLIRSVPASSAILSDGNDPLVFGAIYAPCCGGISNFLNGDLDEIRIYERSLSDAEVAVLGPKPGIELLQQPESWTIGRDASVTLQVAAAGTVGVVPDYQWQRDGIDIAGATNSSLIVSNAVPGTYYYRARVSGGGFELITAESKLRVVENVRPRLVGHWKFEEASGSIAIDSAGGADGSIVQAIRAAGRIGRGALEFDGNAFVEVPASDTDLELVGTTYTLTWWMRHKVESSPVAETIFNLGSRRDQAGYYVDLFGTSLISGHGGSQWTVSIGNLITNWTHCALVWDGAMRRLFVNGVQRASRPGGDTLVSHGNEPLFLGSKGINDSAFRGRLDDIRIYSYALASDEIAALIEPPPALVLQIRRTAGDLSLSWDLETTNSFRLEFSDEVAGPWHPSGAVPITSGTVRTINLPEPPASRFFRLRQL